MLNSDLRKTQTVIKLCWLTFKVLDKRRPKTASVHQSSCHWRCLRNFGPFGILWVTPENLHNNIVVWGGKSTSFIPCLTVPNIRFYFWFKCQFEMKSQNLFQKTQKRNCKNNLVTVGQLFVSMSWTKHFVRIITIGDCFYYNKIKNAVCCFNKQIILCELDVKNQFKRICEFRKLMILLFLL